MKLSKNFLRVNFLALIFLMGTASYAVELENVGVVDTGYILNNYDFVKASYNSMDKAKERFVRLVETADAELKKKKTEDSEKSFNERQEAVQRIVDQELMKLHNDQADLQSIIDARFQDALSIVAKKYSFDVIVDKTYVAGGGVDVTNEVLQTMKDNEKKK